MIATKPRRIAKVKKVPRTAETHLEFHITLPAGRDIDQFTDRLIELVEAFGGMAAGGTVKPEKE